MRNPDFVDKILLAIQKEKIIELHNNRMTAKQIQEEMNISLPWIEEVIAKADEELKVKNTIQPY